MNLARSSNARKSGQNFTDNGKAIFDCHGEIIARRGFKRFLFAELAKFGSGHEENSIFLRQDGIFQLRPEIRFHLYINTATCGDARLFNPNDKVLFD